MSRPGRPGLDSGNAFLFCPRGNRDEACADGCNDPAARGADHRRRSNSESGQWPSRFGNRGPLGRRAICRQHLLVYTDPEETRPTHALKDVVLQSIGGRQMLVGTALAADVAGPWRPGVKISLPWEDVLTYQELTPEAFARSSAGPELQSPSDSRNNRDPQTYGRDARSGSERDTRNGGHDVRNDRLDRDQRPARGERNCAASAASNLNAVSVKIVATAITVAGVTAAAPCRSKAQNRREKTRPRQETQLREARTRLREAKTQPGQAKIQSCRADTLPPPQGAELSSLVAEPPRQETEPPAPKRRKHRGNSWDKWNWRNY